VNEGASPHGSALIAGLALDKSSQVWYDPCNTIAGEFLMNNCLATVTFESVTGLPKDRVVNDFAFAWLGLTPTGETEYEALAAVLETFYNGANISNDLATYMSAEIDRGADRAKVQLYSLDGHLSGTPHGSPVFSSTFTLDASDASASYPAEVSAVLTLRGQGWDTALVESGATRPRQRRTGRVYIGPLKINTGTIASGVVRLTDTFRADLEDAGASMGVNAITNDWEWSVWSRKDALFYPVVLVQTDDAFDTQRRRGPAPTNRTGEAILVP
jgi:hypothetical protein